MKVFFPENGNEARMSINPLLLFNILLEVQGSSIRQEKIKVIRIGKEEIKLIIHRCSIAYG